jgi:hypothetical protein
MYGNAFGYFTARIPDTCCPLFLFNALPALKVNLIAPGMAGTSLAILRQEHRRRERKPNGSMIHIERKLRKGGL